MKQGDRVRIVKVTHWYQMRSVRDFERGESNEELRSCSRSLRFVVTKRSMVLPSKWVVHSVNVRDNPPLAHFARNPVGLNSSDA